MSDTPKKPPNADEIEDAIVELAGDEGKDPSKPPESSDADSADSAEAADGPWAARSDDTGDGDGPDNDADDTTDGDPAAREKPRRGGATGWIALIFLVIGAGGAVASWPYWKDMVGAGGPTGPDPRVAALEGQLKAIDDKLNGLANRPDPNAPIVAKIAERLSALEARPAESANTAGLNADVSTLRDRIAALETAMKNAQATGGGASGPAEDARVPDLAQRIEKLENAPQSSGSSDTLQKLEAELAAQREANAALVARLDAMEKAASGRAAASAGSAAAGGYFIAVGQLRDVIDRGVAFSAPLNAVKTLSGDDAGAKAAIAALTPHAAKGIPTEGVLRRRFPEAAREATSAAVGAPDAGWTDRTLNRLSRVITVRRVEGDDTGNSAPAILGRAEEKLDAGDLKGALAELKSLGEASTRAMAGWTRDANARVAARKALADLTRSAAARLE